MKFRELLEKNHQFPCVYTHKFVGTNDSIFKNSVADFEKKFIGLSRLTERMSASGKHLSLTYEYHAANPDDIIHLIKETHQIHHLIFVI